MINEFSSFQSQNWVNPISNEISSYKKIKAQWKVLQYTFIDTYSNFPTIYWATKDINSYFARMLILETKNMA